MGNKHHNSHKTRTNAKQEEKRPKFPLEIKQIEVRKKQGKKTKEKKRRELIGKNKKHLA